MIMDVQERSRKRKGGELLGFRATTMLSEILDEVIPWVAEQIEVGKI